MVILRLQAATGSAEMETREGLFPTVVSLKDAGPDADTVTSQGTPEPQLQGVGVPGPPSSRN